MRISVREVISESYVNTVILGHNRSNPTNVYLFRCYKCGSPINQIQGYINGIYAGYIPSVEVATISQCHKCHENYTFQTHSKQEKVIKLILSCNAITTFHCVICRTPLVQYGKIGAVRLPEFIRMELPSPVVCFNPMCTALYFLKDIVEMDVV